MIEGRTDAWSLNRTSALNISLLVLGAFCLIYSHMAYCIFLSSLVVMHELAVSLAINRRLLFAPAFYGVHIAMAYFS